MKNPFEQKETFMFQLIPQLRMDDNISPKEKRLLSRVSISRHFQTTLFRYESKDTFRN